MSKDNQSSSEAVNQHLLGLEDVTAEAKTTTLIENQSFTAAELASLVNTKRLQELLNQSDSFLSGLANELHDFDDSISIADDSYGEDGP
jgi:hypothetical protein